MTIHEDWEAAAAAVKAADELAAVNSWAARSGEMSTAQGKTARHHGMPTGSMYVVAARSSLGTYATPRHTGTGEWKKP